MRVIVTPAVLPGVALAELKQWLGVTLAGEDEVLRGLLRAALDVCADFTGVLPLGCTCEETVAGGEWRGLASRPVRALLGVWIVGADGGRTPLEPGSYLWRVGADGGAMLRAVAGGCRVVARFEAGLAEWDTLPDALRHGLIRLAAHAFRARDGEGAGLWPPASVAALWRPWRRLRLA